jgi:SAM-dependent methyltransferase
MGIGPALETRFPPPAAPFAGDYAERHRRFVEATLNDAALAAAFRDGGRLPRGWGVALDERVVEYPWLAAGRPRGRVLDAGSVLNHAHVLDALLADMESLTIATLAPESAAFTERGVSYVYADIRELPFRDDWFDVVVSLSTLEHVGMDNTAYGHAAARSDDPDRELARAVVELRRVAKPGGVVYVSVPFGEDEDHLWFRQLGEERLERLRGLLGGPATTLEVFAYSGDGWQRADVASASRLRYRRPDAPVGADRAAAARAVACLTVRV